MHFTTLFVITIISLIPCFTQAATVTFSQTILPVKIIVVDQTNAVIDVFSNVTPNVSQYELQVRRQSRDGEPLVVTQQLFAAFRQYYRRQSEPMLLSTVQDMNFEQRADGSWLEVTSLISI